MSPPSAKEKEGQEQKYVQVSSNEEEKYRILNPDTGTEADHHWPDVEPEIPPPPLLHLPSVWKCVREGLAVPTPEDPQDNPDSDVFAQNAYILVRELKYHILASNSTKSSDQEKESQKNDHTASSKESPEATDVLKEAATNGETPASAKSEHQDKSAGSNEESSTSKEQEGQSGEDKNKEKAENGEVKHTDNKVCKSVYGASMILKLQWEDRSTQKLVPRRSYSELAAFIANVTMNLSNLLNENAAAANPIIDALALEHASLLFARLLDGVETGTPELETAAFNLLILCSNRANPKEMHVGIQNFVSKIDAVYLQAISYLVFDPFMRVWSNVIVRIPRKRHAFLLDFVKVFDKMNYNCEGYEHISVPIGEGGVGSEQAGRCDLIPDIAIDFFERLVKAQNEHRISSSALQKEVDVLGRALPAFAASKSMGKGEASTDSKPVGNEVEAEAKRYTSERQEAKESVLESVDGKQGKNDDETEKQKESGQEDKAKNDEAHDWVNERAVTLARTLQLMGPVWAQLVPPSGEGTESKPGLKKRYAPTLTKKQDKAEDHLCSLINIIEELGWTNPVLVCQLATKGLYLDPMSWKDRILQSHIVDDVRSKKERKKTMYGVAGVAQFVCGCLRPRTRQRLAGEKGPVDDYNIELDGTGFDLLDGNYAFDLIAPYLMNMIGVSMVTMTQTGILVFRAFLGRIPESLFASAEQMLKVRCGTRSLGREISLFGFAQHLAKAVEVMDDPKHRCVAHETLQMVLKLCKHPMGRYSATENVFHECNRITLLGQMVTEMKDAIRYSDEVVRQGTMEAWTGLAASSLKTRFVQLVMPKYLTPRKDMLSNLNAIVPVGNAMVYIIGSDRRRLKEVEEGSEEMESITSRRTFIQEYVKLGRECVRALAAVAEYDRKMLPNMKIKKEEAAIEQTRAIYTSAGQTLNQCMAALDSFDLVMKMLTS